MRIFLACVLLLAGCATAPEQGTTPGAVSQAPAVQGLVQLARSDAEAGRLGAASASLERALRIEPRNARVWHELALVRLQQGDYAQAESLAARSNSLAGDDAALRAENDRLIAEARAH